MPGGMIGNIPLTHSIPSFFNLPTSDASSALTIGAAIASAEEEPIIYAKEKHGAVQDFLNAPEFEIFKLQYTDDIQAMKDIVNDCLPADDAHTFIEKLKVFEQHLFQNPKYFSATIDVLYSKAKGEFHNLIAMLNLPTTTRDQKVNGLELALNEIDLCAEGIATNVSRAHANMKYLVSGVAGELAKIRTDIVYAEAHDFAQKHHGSALDWANNQMHYVNSYVASVAAEMGITVTNDRFAPPLEPHLNKQFGLRVATAVTPWQIVRTLADGYFDKLSQILQSHHVSINENRSFEGMFGVGEGGNNLHKEINDSVAYPLGAIIEKNNFDAYQLITLEDDDRCSFADVRTKMRTEVSKGLVNILSAKPVTPTLFAKDQGSGDQIMHLGGVRYWVENEAGVQRSLTASNLDKLQLSSWQPNQVHDLCQQAIGQTTDPNELLTFMTTHDRYFTEEADAGAAHAPLLGAHSELKEKLYQFILDKLSTDSLIKAVALAHIENASADELKQLYPLVQFNADFKAGYLTAAVKQNVAVRADLVFEWLADLNIVGNLSAETLNAHYPTNPNQFLDLIQQAVRMGHERATKQLLTTNLDPNAMLHDGSYLLHNATILGHTSIMRTLIELSDIDVNKATIYADETALSVASKFRRLEAVKVLLECNEINVNHQDRVGRTPFFTACQINNLEIVDVLAADTRVDLNLARNDKMNALHYACNHGSNVLVKTLLKSERLDPNIAGPRGLTALHFVAQSNNPDLVRALLDDNRVDATLVSENGHTAQQMAVAEGHREVVDIFNAQLSAANPNT